MPILPRHAVLAQRLSTFIALMSHPGADDPTDRRELCLTMMIDLFVGLGLVNSKYEVVDREAYHARNPKRSQRLWNP